MVNCRWYVLLYVPHLLACIGDIGHLVPVIKQSQKWLPCCDTSLDIWKKTGLVLAEKVMFQAVATVAYRHERNYESVNGR